MASHVDCFKSGPLWVALATVVVLPATAQNPLFRPGQPIVFASPDQGTVASNMPSLTPQLPGALESDDFAPPAPTFANRLPLAGQNILPAAPAPPVDTARLRQLQDRRDNWTLMTPAEILGAVTPEKILGLPERDGFGQPRNRTALERYTDRQNQQSLLAHSNAFAALNAIPASSYAEILRGTSNSPGDEARLTAVLGMPMLNSMADPAMARPDEKGWAKLLGASPALADPAPSSLANRFGESFNSGPSYFSPLASPAAGSEGIKTTLPRTLLNSTPAAALGAPAGNFSPLSDRIGRPSELPRLPGGWNLNYTSAPPVDVWGPQPAPWLSPNPQPLAHPQRKF